MRYVDVARPHYTPNVQYAVAAGAANSCPFCVGRKLGRPRPGSRIQLLMGSRSGQTGTVTNHDNAWETDEFCVQFDFDPSEGMRRVSLRRDQYAVEPIGTPPHWLPPLATDDLACLDEFIVRLYGALFQNDKWVWQDEGLYPLVIRAWLDRLPVRGSDLWEMCAAHGMPNRFKSRFIKSYDFGFDLLLCAHGRRPIQRKRVSPMSIPRYVPKRKNSSVHYDL